MGNLTKQINIVMASDNKGINLLAVAVYSVIKNNKKNKIKFWIFHSDLSDKKQCDIQKLTEENVSIQFIKINPGFLKGIKSSNNAVTMPAYYRYLAPDILLTESKALYMDIDMLCLGDIKKLYETNIGNNYIGAVEDYFVSVSNDYPGFKEGIGFKKDDRYVNSGLLLMNLELLRESGVMIEFWKNIKNKSNLILPKFNIFADQTVANITFKNKIFMLNQKYNAIVSSIKFTKLSSARITIAHFAGEDKPFMCNDLFSAKYSYIYYDYYWECMQKMEVDGIAVFKRIFEKIGQEKSDIMRQFKSSQRVAVDKTNHVQKLAREIEVEREKRANETEALKAEIKSIMSSKSWKITQPLRDLKKVIKK